MPKCPKCGKEVGFLTAIETKNTTSTYYGGHDYDVTDTEIIGEAWMCPECNEQLFDSEEQAKEFLGKEVQNGKS